MSTHLAPRPAFGRPRRASAPRPMMLLRPGLLCTSQQPLAVAALIQTGVVVCLFDEAARVGGAVHFVLPEADPSSAHGAKQAIPMLVAQVEAQGARRGNLVAKVFGGTRVPEPGANQPSLGALNLASARQHLAAADIPIVCVNAGGEKGRQLVFFCDSGQTFVQPL